MHALEVLRVAEQVQAQASHRSEMVVGAESQTEFAADLNQEQVAAQRNLQVREKLLRASSHTAGLRMRQVEQKAEVRSATFQQELRDKLNAAGSKETSWACQAETESHHAES